MKRCYALANALDHRQMINIEEKPMGYRSTRRRGNLDGPPTTSVGSCLRPTPEVPARTMDEVAACRTPETY